MKSIDRKIEARLNNSGNLEAQLDLLVDAELPEDARRKLLQYIATSREGWKMLAIRFLQRQVESQAVRNLLQNPGEAPSRRPSSSGSQHRYLTRGPALKLAASIVLTAVLFGIGGTYFGRQTAMSTRTRNNAIVVQHTRGLLPGATLSSIGNNGFPSAVSVPVVDSHAAPFDYPFGGLGETKSSNRVVIVPEGHNRAVAFPVEEVAAEKVY